MTTILLAAALLALAWGIVAWLNRRDPDVLRQTKERREMQIRSERQQ